jgi:hypothetical protein
MVLFAKPLLELQEGSGGEYVPYIVKYHALSMAEDLFARYALVKSTEYTYQMFMDLEPHNRKSIVDHWLAESLRPGTYEEPDIVY